MEIEISTQFLKGTYRQVGTNLLYSGLLFGCVKFEKF